jgi:hypothetical protein
MPSQTGRWKRVCVQAKIHGIARSVSMLPAACLQQSKGLKGANVDAPQTRPWAAKEGQGGGMHPTAGSPIEGGDWLSAMQMSCKASRSGVESQIPLQSSRQVPHCGARGQRGRAARACRGGLPCAWQGAIQC